MQNCARSVQRAFECCSAQAPSKEQGLRQSMAAPSERGRKRPLAPSLTPRPVWSIMVAVSGPHQLQLLEEAAQKLFARGKQGGTDGVALIIVLPNMWCSDSPERSLLRDHSADAGASSSCQALCCAGQSSTSAGADDLSRDVTPVARIALQVCMVFQAERRKSSVKRTAESLLGQVDQSAINTLAPILFSTVLTRLSSQVATWALPFLQGRVLQYLMGRAHEDLAAPEPIKMTTDLLGPRVQASSRPRLTLAADSVATTVPGSPEVATDSVHAVPSGPDVATESVQANGLAQDPVANLADLLSWSGELTTAIAAERAEALLQAIRSQTEELAIAKSELLYFKWQESLRAEVNAILDHTNPLPSS
jgi:hypothetical protein